MLASLLLASLDFPVVSCGPSVAVVLSDVNISEVPNVARVSALASLLLFGVTPVAMVPIFLSVPSATSISNWFWRLALFSSPDVLVLLLGLLLTCSYCCCFVSGVPDLDQVSAAATFPTAVEACSPSCVSKIPGIPAVVGVSAIVGAPPVIAFMLLLASLLLLACWGFWWFFCSCCPTIVAVIIIKNFLLDYIYQTGHFFSCWTIGLSIIRLSDHCFRKTTELSATGLRNSTIGRPTTGTRKPGKNYRCPALVSSLPPFRILHKLF